MIPLSDMCKDNDELNRSRGREAGAYNPDITKYRQSLIVGPASTPPYSYLNLPWIFAKLATSCQDMMGYNAIIGVRQNMLERDRKFFKLAISSGYYILECSVASIAA